MVRLTDHPAMTIAVDLGRKATKQTNKPNKFLDSHPNFVKNWGWWEGFIFYFFNFRTALKTEQC